VGTVFCPRVLYSLNPPFWPISETLQLPVTVVLHGGKLKDERALQNFREEYASGVLGLVVDENL
jgi:hypothetical protein